MYTGLVLWVWVLHTRGRWDPLREGRTKPIETFSANLGLHIALLLGFADLFVFFVFWAWVCHTKREWVSLREARTKPTEPISVNPGLLIALLLGFVKLFCFWFLGLGLPH